MWSLKSSHLLMDDSCQGRGAEGAEPRGGGVVSVVALQIEDHQFEAWWSVMVSLWSVSPVELFTLLGVNASVNGQDLKCLHQHDY